MQGLVAGQHDHLLYRTFVWGQSGDMVWAVNTHTHITHTHTQTHTHLLCLSVDRLSREQFILSPSHLAVNTVKGRRQFSDEFGGIGIWTQQQKQIQPVQSSVYKDMFVTDHLPFIPWEM